MKSDPLVAALATAAELVLERGVSVTMTEAGWLIRLEPASTPEVGDPSDAAQIRRAW